jgi:arsenate reductase-like glutaredoxin family protein
MEEEKLEFSGINYRLQEMTREELIDALASIRSEIIDKVRRMSNMWEVLAETNEKRERIQIRLERLGVKRREQ